MKKTFFSIDAHRQNTLKQLLTISKYYRYNIYFNMQNLKTITLTKEEALQYHHKYIKFKINEKDFVDISSMYQVSIFYVVSMKYLHEWENFMQTDLLQRVLPQTMNHDLLTSKNQLKSNLKQRQDYFFVPQSLFDCLKIEFAEIKSIKRKAYQKNNKRALSLKNQQQFFFLPLNLQYLQLIKQKPESLSFQFKCIDYISEKGTIEDLIIQIAKDYPNNKVRLWRIQVGTKVSHFKEYLCKKLKNTTSQNQIQLPDAQIIWDENETLESLDLQSDQFFIAECVVRRTPWLFIQNAPIKRTKKIFQFTQKSRKGQIGLTNIGNSCYMNSVIQCLSNTERIRSFLLSFARKITKKSRKSKKRVSIQFTVLLSNMWYESKSSIKPQQLKKAIAESNRMFANQYQQDAHEFLTCFLDLIKEESNRVPGSALKPEEAVGQQVQENFSPVQKFWESYSRKNQSHYDEVITGIQGSEIQCPNCHYLSQNFNTFTSLSLSIPENVQFYIVYLNHTKVELVEIALAHFDANKWMQIAQQKTDNQEKVFKFYNLDNDPENVINIHTENLKQLVQKKVRFFLLELTIEENKNLSYEINMVYTHRISGKMKELWYKRPFFFTSKVLKGAQIRQKAVEYLYLSCYREGPKCSKNPSLQKLKNLLLENMKIYLKRFKDRISQNQIQFKEQIEVNNETDVGDLCDEAGEEECELQFCLNEDIADQFQFSLLKKFTNRQKSRKKITLQKCLKQHLAEEKLDKDNAWGCPSCFQLQQATKRMVLIKAPNIFIIHLKRFKTEMTGKRVKITEDISFPLELNMAAYLKDSSPMCTLTSYLKDKGLYIEPTFQSTFDETTPPIYKLYGIINHYGGINGGHYTAYAKNQEKWLEYNDINVEEKQEKDVITANAFILFYSRYN